MAVILGWLYLGFKNRKFGIKLKKDIISRHSRLQFTLGCWICDSYMKMHDIHSYFRYTNSYLTDLISANVLKFGAKFQFMSLNYYSCDFSLS